VSILVTDAIVLHAADYLESSRIMRLVTREAGVQSVLARGARASRKRFGSAVDLYAEGQAQIQLKPGRELQTLHTFEVQQSRSAIASDLERFTAAAALAECVLRVVHDEAATQVYGTIADGFARIASANSDDIVSETLGTLWRIVSDIGLTPILAECAVCHTLLEQQIEQGDLRFSHEHGGVLCRSCASMSVGGRLLPSHARLAISDWLLSRDVSLSSPAVARSHQRLFREFLVRHAAGGRPLKAFLVWESAGWAET